MAASPPLRRRAASVAAVVLLVVLVLFTDDSAPAEGGVDSLSLLVSADAVDVHPSSVTLPAPAATPQPEPARVGAAAAVVRGCTVSTPADRQWARWLAMPQVSSTARMQQQQHSPALASRARVECLRAAASTAGLVVIGDSLTRDIVWNLMLTWPSDLGRSLPSRHLSLRFKLPLAPTGLHHRTDTVGAGHRHQRSCVESAVRKDAMLSAPHFAASTFPVTFRWTPEAVTVDADDADADGRSTTAVPLPDVTLVSRGLWDAMNLGKPPTRLHLGAMLIVRDFFRRAALEVPAANPSRKRKSPPLLVYYVPHCSTSADAPTPFRRRVTSSTVLEPFRRAAACGVARELARLAHDRREGFASLSEIGSVAVFDACDAVRASPPGTTKDGLHVVDERRFPLVDDVLGRFVCPGYQRRGGGGGTGSMGRWNGTWASGGVRADLKRTVEEIGQRFGCQAFDGVDVTNLEDLYSDEHGHSSSHAGRQVHAADTGLLLTAPTRPVSGWRVCPINSTRLDRDVLGWTDHGDTVCRMPEYRFVVDECDLTQQTRRAYEAGGDVGAAADGSGGGLRQLVASGRAGVDRDASGHGAYGAAQRFAENLLRGTHGDPRWAAHPADVLAQRVRSPATVLINLICAATSVRAASVRNPAQSCVRFPYTGIDLDRVAPGSRGFDLMMLQLCRWPRAWPVCALNLGARVLGGETDESGFRRRLALRANLSEDDARALCVPPRAATVTASASPRAEGVVVGVTATLAERLRSEGDSAAFFPPRRRRDGDTTSLHFACGASADAFLDACSSMGQ